MKKTLVSAALLALFAGGAFAQDLSATGNVALTTNYKFRGQDQTENKAAIQGGFDLGYGGFYVGNWNSSVSWVDAFPSDNSGLEADFYGGYKGELGGFGYDVGVLRYQYPGASAANTTEIYGALSYGIASAKYSHTVSKEYFGLVEGRGTGYLDLAANYELMPSVTLNAHLGFTRYPGDAKSASPGLPNYVDYKLGATYAFGSGFALAGAVVGANERGFYGDINKPRFVLTLSKAL